MNSFSVSPMSRRNIRKLVTEFRKMFGLEKELRFPIVEFIEWVLGQLGLEFEVVSISEMPNAYGITNPGTDSMKIREDVYVGAVNGNPRDRFTLCHELGHYLIHFPDRVTFARGTVPPYMNPEWQANAFAGELMAPYDLVKDMSAEEIAEQCGMSITAATIQYRQYH